MAHIPLIHGPDGAKLSKRHGALGVDAYRAMGYLPAALRNYLARLGWSQGDKEFFSTEELIAAFDLPAIGRSPSRFDYAKLENMNGHYMRATPDDALMAILVDALPYLPGGPDARRRARRGQARPARRRAARPQGARQDADRAGRRRRLPVRASGRCAIDAKAEEILARDGRRHIAALLPRLEAVAHGAPRPPRRRCATTRPSAASSSASSPSRCAPRRPAARPRRASSTCSPCSAATRALGRLRDQAAAG